MDRSSDRRGRGPDGALFNLFVRFADAFDIHPPAVMDPDGVPAAITRSTS